MRAESPNILKSALKFLGMTFTVVVFSAGIFLARIYYKPLSLKFLRPYIENLLIDKNAGQKLTFKKIYLHWQGGYSPFKIILKKVELKNKEGKTLFSTPSMLTHVDVISFASGGSLIKALELNSPLIALTKSEEGIQVKLPEAKEEFFVASKEKSLQPFEFQSVRDLEKHVSNLLENLSAKFYKFKNITGFHNLKIHNGNITLQDSTSGFYIELAAIDIHFAIDNDMLHVNTKFNAIPKQKAAATSANSKSQKKNAFLIDAHFNNPAKKLYLTVSSSGISLKDFVPATKKFKHSDVNFTGKAAMEFSQAKGVERISGNYFLNSGSLVLDDFEAPIEVKKGKLSFTITEQLSTANLNIENLWVNETQAEGKVHMSREGEVFIFEPNLSVKNVSFNTLKNLWPKSLGGSPRSWVTRNLRDGISPYATFLAKIKVSDKAEVLSVINPKGVIDVEDVTIDYLKDFPVIKKARGTAKYTDKKFDISIQSGSIYNALNIKNGKIFLLDLDKPREKAEIDLNIESDLKHILRLIDNPPLKYAKKYGFDPTRSSGKSTVNLKMNFPLGSKTELSDVRIKVNGQVDRVTLTKKMDSGHLLEVKQGNISIGLDNTKMKVHGKVSFAGPMVNLVWGENFESPKSTVSSYLSLQGPVPASFFKLFNVDVDRFAKEQVDVKISFKEFQGGESHFEGNFNLQPTKLDIFGFEKQSGVPGEVEVSIYTTSSGVEIKKLKVKSPGLMVDGVGNLSEDNSVRYLRFDRLLIGETDITPEIFYLPSKTYKVLLKGKQFNFNLIREAMKGAPSAQGLPACEILVNLSKLYFSPTKGFDKTFGVLRYDGKWWRFIKMNACMDNSCDVLLEFQPKQHKQEFLLQVHDMGEFLKRLDVVDTIEGGKLEIKGFRPLAPEGIPVDEGAVKGEVSINNFKALKPSILMRIVSISGIFEALAGTGMNFASAKATYTFTDDALIIYDGLALGGTLGVTYKGRINRLDDSINFKGIIIPAYILNSFLSNIPIIGNILTGGDAVVGTVYKVTGTTKEPKIGVNPLSNLTPGIFRKMFEGRDPTKEKKRVALKPDPEPQSDKEKSE